MRMHTMLVTMMATVMLSGCASTPDGDELVASLLAVDTEFARHSAKHGAADAFGKYMTDDAVILPRQTDAIHGRRAIVESMRPLDDGWVLDWTPVHASASDDGSLGYTWGHYELYRKENSDGRLVGKYLRVWRRGSQGSWLAISDIDNLKPPVLD